ncbi:troponin C, skeletal muscle-like [Hypanus sabinus]|uniref:troponin C, skeletal muscle-like n=1 Tax=Hypanus sabinus TaxID=79690 RepID=UPI0028C3E02D|nr:troponin C, skeletal muscle-like [Hypanus sabinus]
MTDPGRKRSGWLTTYATAANSAACALMVLGNGTIGFDEFLVRKVRQVNQKAKGKYEEEFAKTFRKFDSNVDGFIEWDELQSLILTTGQHITEEEMNELMKEADKNNDGKLDFDEWMKLVENIQ